MRKSLNLGFAKPAHVDPNEELHMRFKSFAAKAKSTNWLKKGCFLTFHYLNPTPYPRKYTDLASVLHNPKWANVTT